MLLPALAALLLALGSAAQKPGADEVQVASHGYRLARFTFSSQTQSVSDEVVVRDRAGLPVAGLQRGQFQIFDDGRSRPLASFRVMTAATPPLLGGADSRAQPPAAGSSPPPGARYLALYFDDVNTAGKDLMEARRAALEFTARALRPDDAVGVFTNSGLQALGFTRDRSALRATISAINAHPRAAPFSAGCLRISQYQAYLIVNHLDPAAAAAAQANQAACDAANGMGGDAGQDLMPSTTNLPSQVSGMAETIWMQARAASESTLESIADALSALSREPGSRVLLVASDGFLGGTLEGRQDEIVQAALRDRVTISALSARGLEAAGPGLPLDEQSELGTVPPAMYRFEETSKLSEQQASEAAMANLALSTGGLLFHNNNDLALGFARLGLQPSAAYELAFTPTGLVHDGKLHQLKVEVTPDQHYTIQARRAYYAPPPDTPANHLADAIDAAMRSGAGQTGLPVTVRIAGTSVHFHLDLHGVPFQREKGREREKLVFTIGWFDAQGAFLAGKQAEMDLELRDKTWRAMLASGLNATLTLETVPQAAQLRCVVAEANTGKLFSAAIR